MSGYTDKTKFRARSGFAHAVAEIVRDSHVRLVMVEDIDYALSSSIKVKGLTPAIEENLSEAADLCAMGKTMRGTVPPIVVARVNQKYIEDMDPTTWEVPIPDDDTAMQYDPGMTGTPIAALYIVESPKFPVTMEGKRLIRSNHFHSELIADGIVRRQKVMGELLIDHKVLTPKQLGRVAEEAVHRLDSGAKWAA